MRLYAAVKMTVAQINFVALCILQYHGFTEAKYLKDACEWNATEGSYAASRCWFHWIEKHDLSTPYSENEVTTAFRLLPGDTLKPAGAIRQSYLKLLRFQTASVTTESIRKLYATTYPTLMPKLPLCKERIAERKTFCCRFKSIPHKEAFWWTVWSRTPLMDTCQI